MLTSENLGTDKKRHIVLTSLYINGDDDVVKEMGRHPIRAFYTISM